MSSNYMKRYCPASCYAEEEPEDEKQRVAKESEEFGLLQEAVGSSADKTLDIIRLSIEYMKTKETGEACSNKHKYCSFWAVIGELPLCLLSLWLRYQFFLFMLFMIFLPPYRRVREEHKLDGDELWASMYKLFVDRKVL